MERVRGMASPGLGCEGLCHRAPDPDVTGVGTQRPSAGVGGCGMLGRPVWLCCVCVCTVHI